eukprot:g2375.t1
MKRLRSWRYFRRNLCPKGRFRRFTTIANATTSSSLQPGTTLNVLKLDPNESTVIDMLNIEEKLFRLTPSIGGNWVILCPGAVPSSIVMGISARQNELLVKPLVVKDDIPVIKRFTGGGTVFVDENTVFISFILNEGVPLQGKGSSEKGPSQSNSALIKEPVKLYPRDIMDWTSTIYSDVFNDSNILNRKKAKFELLEHDYIIRAPQSKTAEIRKFGGNAQSITKGRFVHHTSFLWNFEESNMKYLQNPSKAPEYRKKRNHGEFLTTLKTNVNEHVTKEVFFDQVVQSLIASDCSTLTTVREWTMHDRSFQELLSESKKQCTTKLLDVEV